MSQRRTRHIRPAGVDLSCLPYYSAVATWFIVLVMQPTTGWNSPSIIVSQQEPTSSAAPGTEPVSQLPEPDRLPADQMPGEADVLLSEELTGWPITVNFVDTNIRDVARFFSSITGLNIVVDPEVQGPVTVNLFDVPWDLAFGAIMRSYQLGHQVEENIVRVASLGRLAEEATHRAELANQEALAAPLRTVTLPLSYARAAELLELMEAQLSTRGQVMRDERTNSLIIKDTAAVIGDISELIETLDIAAPQVVIQSRIVETTKDFSHSFGIQWGFSGVADAAHGNTTGLVFPNSLQVEGNHNLGFNQAGIGGAPFAVNLPATDSTAGVALTRGSILDTFRLDLALSAMEEEGRGKIISAPKVTAQNNIEATIESGQRIPVQTLIDNTASLQFINANLQLRVVPQITDERTIMLDITVDKSEPDFQNSVLGIPTIFTRKAETKVLVRDGGTTVIGGIFQMAVSETTSRVPLLHRIPLLGWLFSSKRNSQRNNELLIFITPRILEK